MLWLRAGGADAKDDQSSGGDEEAAYVSRRGASQKGRPEDGNDSDEDVSDGEDPDAAGASQLHLQSPASKQFVPPLGES